MIKINKFHEDFQNLQFVLKARSKNKIKPVFTLLNVEDGQAICTDSYRAHFAPCSLGPGLYEIITATKSEIVLEPYADTIQFPDCKRLIPKKGEGSTSVKIGLARPGTMAGKIIAAYARNVASDVIDCDLIYGVWDCDIEMTTTYERQPILITDGVRIGIYVPVIMRAGA